jgi:hypothetical protein
MGVKVVSKLGSKGRWCGCFGAIRWLIATSFVTSWTFVVRAIVLDVPKEMAEVAFVVLIFFTPTVHRSPMAFTVNIRALILP